MKYGQKGETCTRINMICIIFAFVIGLYWDKVARTWMWHLRSHTLNLHLMTALSVIQAIYTSDGIFRAHQENKSGSKVFLSVWLWFQLLVMTLDHQLNLWEPLDFEVVDKSEMDTKLQKFWTRSLPPPTSNGATPSRHLTFCSYLTTHEASFKSKGALPLKQVQPGFRTDPTHRMTGCNSTRLLPVLSSHAWNYFRFACFHSQQNQNVVGFFQNLLKENIFSPEKQRCLMAVSANFLQTKQVLNVFTGHTTCKWKKGRFQVFYFGHEPLHDKSSGN